MATYREDNWSFNPEIDLDYENKFFEIQFNSNINIEKIDSVWRMPIKDFLEKDNKGKVLNGFPDPSILGFFVEDTSKEYLTVLVDTLKNMDIPEDVSVIRWKNYKENQTFNSFSEFQASIKSL